MLSGPLLPPRRRTRILLSASFIVVLIVASLAVWIVSTNASAEIERLGRANSDNTQWSLAQSELELLAVQTALHQAEDAPEDLRGALLDEARLRFDIFYARMSTLEHTVNLEQLQNQPVVRQALEAGDAYLRRNAPLMEGPDAALLAAVPELIARTEALRPLIRSLTLEGVRVFAERADNQRRHLQRAMTDLAAIVLLLFLALLATVITLTLLVRNMIDQSAQIGATRDRLQAVIRTSIDAIIVADRQGAIRDFNDVACRLWNMQRSEALTCRLTDLLVSEDRHRLIDQLLERMAAEPVRLEMTQALARRRTGELFPVEASASSAQTAAGPVLVVFMRDVSERLAKEAELVRARDTAVAGEQAKARMLAIMSHEMRTPLNGVLGTLDLLKTTRLDRTQRHFVEAMEQSGRLLLTHVNDVLDISRADSGHLRLAREPFDSGRTASEIVAALRSEASRRGNTLSLVVTNPLNEMPVGDPARVSQILMNLVGNALKFTRDGHVRVEVEQEAGALLLRVIDTGIGIDPADMDRIFDEFVTLDSSYGRPVEGTGLGLGIVRRLVAAMGGDLTVESRPGTGSTFSVRLPMPDTVPNPAGAHIEGTEGAHDALPLPAPPAPEALAPRAPRQLPAAPRPLDVLVVEDNVTNRMIVREMLRRRGCTVTEAGDGREGVEQAARQRFDLILMDISMPRLDGLSAARQIRQQPPNERTPIIALTAHALPEELAGFRAAGMDGTLTKPLTLNRLDLLLARHSSGLPPLAEPDEALMPVVSAAFVAGGGGPAIQDSGQPIPRADAADPALWASVSPVPSDPAPAEPAPVETAAAVGADAQDHPAPEATPPDRALEAARRELAQSLGRERADSVLRRLLAELEQGLGRLSLMADDDDPALIDLARLAHRLAGTAALAGLSQMHRLLLEMETETAGAARGRETSNRLHRQIAALRTLLPPAP